MMFSRFLLIGLGLFLTTHPVRDGNLAGQVYVDGRPVAQAVVSIENPKLAAAHNVQTTVRLDHSGPYFRPRVLPIVTGTTVRIGSSAGMPCRLYSVSQSARFNLTRQKEKTKTLTLDKPGVVEIRCEDHPEARAYIVVKNNPYFALTDKQGTFTIRHVPRGVHSVQVWVENHVVGEGTTVEIGNGDVETDLRLRSREEDGSPKP